MRYGKCLICYLSVCLVVLVLLPSACSACEAVYETEEAFTDTTEEALVNIK